VNINRNYCAAKSKNVAEDKAKINKKAQKKTLKYCRRRQRERQEGRCNKTRTTTTTTATK